MGVRILSLQIYTAGLGSCVPSKTCTLWVDAFSISQEDVQERGEQVLLMKFIFNLAKTVHVWLGEAVSGSDEAL